MSEARYDREGKEQVRLYAAEHGVTTGAARAARMRNTTKWQGFLDDTWAKANPAVEPPAGEAQELEVVGKSALVPVEAENKSDPAKMERALLVMWQQTYKQWYDLARGQGDPMVMASLAITITKIRQEYSRAMEARVNFDLSERKLIPIAEFDKVRSEFILPLRDAMFNMPAECGPLANSGDNEAGRAGCREWLTSRLMPTIDRLIEKLSEEGS